jgi:hypothetical protein
LLRYPPEELERFLLEIDHELEKPVSIVIIGGAAVALGYGSKRATKDIDLWPDLKAMQPFWDAIERVKRRTGMAIPITPTPVAEAPERFEERLQQYPLRGARRLTVFLPERHDLVMMKTARGETPDLEATIDIHRQAPLDPDVLIQRYSEMIGIVTGPPSRFRLSFLGMIDAVFGEHVAAEVDTKIPRARQRRN